MNRDPITEQRGLELEPHLTLHGWRVVERTREGLDWWADELWTLESIWTPIGLRLYLTFLNDPMDAGEVWALAATMTIPMTRGNAESGQLIRLRNVWGRRLPSWLEQLHSFRTDPRSETENRTPSPARPN
jgi:hypothetical protein